MPSPSNRSSRSIWDVSRRKISDLKCRFDRECPENSYCNYLGDCICWLPFRSNIDYQSCYLPDHLYGSDCTNDQHCHQRYDSHLACSNRYICDCVKYFRFNAETNRCECDSSHHNYALRCHIGLSDQSMNAKQLVLDRLLPFTFLLVIVGFIVCGMCCQEIPPNSSSSSDERDEELEEIVSDGGDDNDRSERSNSSTASLPNVSINPPSTSSCSSFSPFRRVNDNINSFRSYSGAVGTNSMPFCRADCATLLFSSVPSINCTCTSCAASTVGATSNNKSEENTSTTNSCRCLCDSQLESYHHDGNIEEPPSYEEALLLILAEQQEQQEQQEDSARI